MEVIVTNTRDPINDIITGFHNTTDMFSTDAGSTNSTGDNRTDILTKSLLVLCLSAISLSGVFGNSLVVIAVCRIRTLHSVTDYFICSLACADLFVSAVIMPFAIVTEVSEGKWLFGTAFCSIWSSMDILCCTASVWNLCALSLDRYIAILKPLVYKDLVTPRNTCLSIIAVWVISTLLASSQLLWKYLWLDSDPPYTCLYAPEKSFRIFATLSAFFIPMSITVTVYFRIIPVAFRQARQITNARLNGKRASQSSIKAMNTINEYSALDQAISLESLQKHSTSLQDREGKSSPCKQSEINRLPPNIKQPASSDSPEERRASRFASIASISPPSRPRTLSETSSSSSRNDVTLMSTLRKPLPSRPSVIFSKSRYKELKVIRTLLMVVGVFFVCWIPFAITIAIEPFLSKPLSMPMMSAFLWLGYFNSVSNPVIYVWMNKTYRRAFKRVLCGRRGRQDGPDEI